LPGSTVSTKPASVNRNQESCEKAHTRNVLVPAEGSNNSGLVGEEDLVVGVGREEALEEGDSRVENDGALSSGLDADLDLVVVDDVAADTLDVGRRLAVEVGGTEEATELEGVGLARGRQYRVVLKGKIAERKLTSPRAVVSVLEPA
jgi:hypothetical protein